MLKLYWPITTDLLGWFEEVVNSDIPGIAEAVGGIGVRNNAGENITIYTAQTAPLHPVVSCHGTFRVCDEEVDYIRKIILDLAKSGTGHSTTDHKYPRHVRTRKDVTVSFTMTLYTDKALEALRLFAPFVHAVKGYQYGYK